MWPEILLLNMERRKAMGPSNLYEMIKKIAANGLTRQKVNPGDYADKEGLLVCGVCHERRQDFIMVDAPTVEEPERQLPVKVAVNCRCDREREEEKKRRDANEKAMERVRRLRSDSLIDEKFREATFNTFRETKDNTENLKLCRMYVRDFDKMVKRNQGLILWGDVGTGKSYAAACIANELLSNGVPVAVLSLVKLLGAIQDGEYRESDTVELMNSAKLVIFDDLGSERSTDYALEKVYSIIDSRYRRKLPMIVTTNLTIEEMKEETDRRYKRIYDRVFEVCSPMQFTGRSWRKRTANSRFQEMEKWAKGGGEA